MREHAKLDSTPAAVAVSVVMPTFNGAAWLPKSIPKIDAALKRADPQSAEILVVNDGSTDDTLEALKTIQTTYPLRVISQQNSGRFLARKFGTEQAAYDTLLFIDTRIYIASGSLAFLFKEIAKHPERKIWTSHVYLDKTGNIYARFWDTITSLAWRKYFAHPRDCSYGLEEFDRFPKGTTCFFVPRGIMQDANEWFAKNSKDLKNSNDDTLLIRHMAEKNNINISPEFSCTYHARSNFKQYLKHVFHRGKVFVDGFLRRDGNRFFWFIIAFLATTTILPLVLLLMPHLIIPLVLLGGAIWLTLLGAILLLGINPRDALSFFILLLPFVLAYGAGIWVATLNLHMFKRQRRR